MSRFVTKKKLNELIMEKMITPSDARLVEGVVVIEKDYQIRTVFHKQIKIKN